MNKKMNVMLCLDDIKGDYTRHAAVTILSLLETNKNHKIKIYILSGCLPQENINELKRIVNLYNQEIEIIISDNIIPEELKKVMINKNNLTRGVRYRRFFPRFIKGTDRILSIDCDVLIMKDIYKIYNMNMKGKAIAGYYDARGGLGKVFGTKNYINAGVLLFDTKKYDMTKINVENLESINRKYSKYFTGSDQDKINVIFKDDIIIGPHGMNYQLVSKHFNNIFNKGIDGAEIVHCIWKPYIKYGLIPDKFVNIYHQYLDLTKRKGYPLKAPSYGYVTYLYKCCRDIIVNILKKILGENIITKLMLWKGIYLRKNKK